MILKKRKKMNNQKLNIREGTVSFWINENKLQFNDNQITRLLQLSPPNGSVFIIKDNDNKMKFFHVYLGKGRTDIEYDVSNLSPNKRHMIVITWSLKNKEIIMYIDGQQATKSEIKYKN